MLVGLSPLRDKQWSHSFPGTFLIPRVKLSLSFVASLSRSCQNFTLAGKPGERKETGKRDFGVMKRMFSKLVPETGHQKDLDFMPQVSLWDPLPQPSVCEVTHGGPTPTRLSYFLVARPQKPQAGQAWCGWEKASCRAAAGSVFTFRRLMGAGVAIGMHLEIYQPEAFKYSLCVLPRPFFSLAHPSITSALCAAGPEASIAISCPHLVEMK